MWRNSQIFWNLPPKKMFDQQKRVAFKKSQKITPSYCAIGWSEITFSMKLQAQAGRYGEILLKNMCALKICLIQLKTKALWRLKVAHTK